MPLPACLLPVKLYFQDFVFVVQVPFLVPGGGLHPARWLLVQGWRWFYVYLRVALLLRALGPGGVWFYGGGFTATRLARWCCSTCCCFWRLRALPGALAGSAVLFGMHANAQIMMGT